MWLVGCDQRVQNERLLYSKEQKQTQFIAFQYIYCINKLQALSQIVHWSNSSSSVWLCCAFHSFLDNGLDGRVIAV